MTKTYADGLREGAKICKQKVKRDAEYGGRFGGYGDFMGDMTGPECAAAILARAEQAEKDQQRMPMQDMAGREYIDSVTTTGTQHPSPETALADRLRKLIPGCDCANPSQCWEPCGELGHSEQHVRLASPEDELAVATALRQRAQEKP